MKLKIRYILSACLVAAGLSSCQDWLTEEQPNQQDLKDFFTSGAAAIQTVNACYVPLTWDLNTVYYNEWWVGDIASDDAVKGGQNDTDMADAYDIENFKTVASNNILLSYYRAQYKGIARCNVALKYIPEMSLQEDMDEPLRQRLLAEAKFLRAYYYFRLVRMFGGVPRPTDPVMSADRWKMPRETADAVYELILQDLADAEAVLPLRSQYAPEELGRATKGAAQAMLMKVNLYLKKYDEVLAWGKKIIPLDGAKGEYDLCQDFLSQFRVSGENSQESVFEVQYDEDMYSDYGGDGFTRGNFTVILTRPRTPNLGGVPGWGFNHPSQDLYEEFEAGDPRREWTIVTPTDAEIQTPTQEIYYGNRYVSRKYLHEADANTSEYRFQFLELAHDSRAPLNRKEIRYADVLLMYAEACIESGQETDKALAYINKIRGRVGLTPAGAATREVLRHERRVELAMEGHRWFDLVRWGIAKQTMMDYREKYKTGKSNTTTEGDAMADFIEGKHELMPIPQEEVRLGGLAQNPGY